jgi:hypothetical protein
VDPFPLALERGIRGAGGMQHDSVSLGFPGIDGYMLITWSCDGAAVVDHISPASEGARRESSEGLEVLCRVPNLLRLSKAGISKSRR